MKLRCPNDSWRWWWFFSVFDSGSLSNQVSKAEKIKILTRPWTLAKRKPENKWMHTEPIMKLKNQKPDGKKSLGLECELAEPNGTAQTGLCDRYHPKYPIPLYSLLPIEQKQIEQTEKKESQFFDRRMLNPTKVLPAIMIIWSRRQCVWPSGRRLCLYGSVYCN